MWSIKEQNSGEDTHLVSRRGHRASKGENEGMKKKIKELEECHPLPQKSKWEPFLKREITNSSKNSKEVKLCVDREKTRGLPVPSEWTASGQWWGGDPLWWHRLWVRRGSGELVIPLEIIRSRKKMGACCEGPADFRRAICFCLGPTWANLK